jgi:hypothetical protein
LFVCLTFDYLVFARHVIIDSFLFVCLSLCLLFIQQLADQNKKKKERDGEETMMAMVCGRNMTAGIHTQRAETYFRIRESNFSDLGLRALRRPIAPRNAGPGPRVRPDIISMVVMVGDGGRC